MAREAGEQFGSYRIEGAIGASQMSDVYVALDQTHEQAGEQAGEQVGEQAGAGRRIALKIMSSTLSESPRFRERFRREAEAASSIDHPNVLPIYDSGDVDGTMFLAMRLVEGVDLRDVLLERGTISPEETVRLLRQAAHGLDAAHACGVVHRDVKPDNFLIDDHGGPGEHLYVCDFGIAFREVDARLTIVGEAFGTLGYTAPEQMRSEVVGPAADVFSLGCVAYECLSGSVPAFADGEPASMRDLRPELAALPEAVDAFFARCLANEPGDRFRTCGEAIDELDRSLHGTDVAAPEPGPSAGAAETRRITLQAAETLAEEWAVAGPREDAQATVVLPAGQRPPVEAPSLAANDGPVASTSTSETRPTRGLLWISLVVGVVLLVVVGAVVWRASATNVEAGAPSPTAPEPPGAGPAPTTKPPVEATSSTAARPKPEALADRNPVTACNGCGPRGRVVVNGQRLFHAIVFPSIAVDMPQSSTYDIGGVGATRLRGTMGLDEESETKAPIVMVVLGDGKVLMREQVQPGETRNLDVDVSGVDRLELKVEPPAALPSGSPCCVSAIWGDLTLDFA